MIKVLNIISDSNIGGAGRCVLTFLKYFDRTSFSAKVVVPRGSLLIPEINKLGIKTIEADAIAEKSLSMDGIKELKKIIKSSECDIVHTHGNMSGRIAGKQCGKKVVYTRHSVFPVSPKISKGLGKKINGIVNMHYADDIIAVAEAAKENLTDGGIAAEKVKVILNGVEPQKRASDETIFKLREKYGIENGDFTVGIMARIEEVKGHIYLIEAAEKIAAQGKKIKILIIGTGALEESLKQAVRDKGLENIVIFTGFIKNVNEVLSILDVQANASFGTEATSLSLLEGMSLGIPAVVSNYGGNPGVISHGENGYIFKLKDSNDMAKYIMKLMDEPETYKYMQKKSVEIFNNKFTAEIYARNIEKVYSELMR
ncbi:MAG: glycosyltransferase family 4 protein [Candidatus Metalachnospira sp.]|nr:glycosyltransferase family 4 protein [Candidatus Metalachnospira sp.]